MATLGALLDERGERIGVLVIGGGSLLLPGVVEGLAADVDIVGFSSPTGYAKTDTLPGVRQQYERCAPPGTRGPGLLQALRGRRQGERSKHFVDLRTLAPAGEQLLDAARWTRPPRSVTRLLGELRRILGLLGVEAPDGDL